MPGTTSRIRAWAAVRSTSSRRAKASGSISAKGLRSRSPTLCTRMSTGPARVTSTCVAARAATSQKTAAPAIRAVRPSSLKRSGKVDIRWDIRLLRQPELALYWQMLQLPKVIGHRGAAAYAPENTLASFREARRRGATWVETDVVLTADGVPILMHDDSLKRTTGIDRLVAETRRAELPSDVPTFEEAIACWGELGLGCNVEIKPTQRREADTAP